jgi:hypothetical protein
MVNASALFELPAEAPTRTPYRGGAGRGSTRALGKNNDRLSVSDLVQGNSSFQLSSRRGAGCVPGDLESVPVLSDMRSAPLMLDTIKPWAVRSEPLVVA